MDVRMPRVSGLDAQRRLAESGVEIPLIFVTGHADISAVVRAMKAGAVEVFGKPFDHQAFIDAVHRAIDRDRRRREERRTLDILRGRFESLSAREREVMALVVTGKLNKVVAAELGTTEKTVKAQRAQVMRKWRPVAPTSSAWRSGSAAWRRHALWGIRQIPPMGLGLMSSAGPPYTLLTFPGTSPTNEVLSALSFRRSHRRVEPQR
jgi:hypothetical protein